MDATDLLSKLWLATWTSSAAMLAVCLLRGPVRRHFGAGAAYGLWWLVPAALLANLLPGRTRVIDLPTVYVTPSAEQMAEHIKANKQTLHQLRRAAMQAVQAPGVVEIGG